MAKTKCPRKGTLFSTSWNTPVITTGDCAKGKVEVGTVGSGVVALKRKDLVQVRGKAKEAVRQALAASGDHLVEWLVRNVKPSKAAAKALAKAEKAAQPKAPRAQRVHVPAPADGMRYMDPFRNMAVAPADSGVRLFRREDFPGGEVLRTPRQAVARSASSRKALPDAYAAMNEYARPTARVAPSYDRQYMDDLYNR